MASLLDDIKRISQHHELLLELQWAPSDQDMTHVMEFNLNAIRMRAGQFKRQGDDSSRVNAGEIVDVSEKSIKIQVHLNLEKALFGNNKVFEKPPSPRFGDKTKDSWELRQIAEVLFRSDFELEIF